MVQGRDLARFLQSPSAREREARNLAAAADPPVRIGPAEFSAMGSMVAVRCPRKLDPLMEKAGGQWDPSSKRWLVERRRINPLVRNLRRATDPLFPSGGNNARLTVIPKSLAFDA